MAFDSFVDNTAAAPAGVFAVGGSDAETFYNRLNADVDGTLGADVEGQLKNMQLQEIVDRNEFPSVDEKRASWTSLKEAKDGLYDDVNAHWAAAA